MIYLSEFHFPGEDREWSFFARQQRTCYDSYYPFQLFPARGLRALELADVTILYGGNGSGKTTALNVMAETLHLRRFTPFNTTSFFPDYCRLCSAHLLHPLPPDSWILTSDDVFDFMMDLRAINDGIDRRRDGLMEEVQNARYARVRMNSLADYDRLKLTVEARRRSDSQYARARLMHNVRTHSNGESAFEYFTHAIGEDALYLLDEPENSLSPANQLKLAQFIEDSARFFHCQFILSTHSPLLLALKGAKVYDLDRTPPAPVKWTELETVQVYRQFFESHRDEF